MGIITKGIVTKGVVAPTNPDPGAVFNLQQPLSTQLSNTAWQGNSNVAYWDGTRFFIGGVNTGSGYTTRLAYTTNLGTSWTETLIKSTNDGFGLWDVTSMAYNGSVWVATGVNGARQMFRSTNLTSWFAIDLSSIYSGQCFWYGTIWNGTYFCAITNSGGKDFIRSTDGSTWTAYSTLNTAWGDAGAYSLAVNGANLVAAGGFGKIAYSSDHGATWTGSASFNNNFGGGVLNHGLAYGAGKFVYMSGSSSNNLWVSTDNGVNWTNYSANILAATIGFTISGGCQVIWTGRNFVCVTNNNTYLIWSNDGINWRRSTGFNTVHNNYTVAADNVGNLMMVGNNPGASAGSTRPVFSKY